MCTKAGASKPPFPSPPPFLAVRSGKFHQATGPARLHITADYLHRGQQHSKSSLRQAAQAAWVR